MPYRVIVSRRSIALSTTSRGNDTGSVHQLGTRVLVDKAGKESATIVKGLQLLFTSNCNCSSKARRGWKELTLLWQTLPNDHFC